MNLRQKIVSLIEKNYEEYEISDGYVIKIKLLHKPTKTWRICRLSGKDLDRLEEQESLGEGVPP